MTASYYDWFKRRGGEEGGKEKVRQGMGQNKTVDWTFRVRRSKTDTDRKNIYSPSSSPPPSTPNRRGRGREQADNIKEFDRRIKGSSNRQLWSPSSGGLPRSSQLKAQPPGNQSRPISRAKIAQYEMEEPEADDSYTEDPSISQFICQPETRPISQEQLAVKGIYAELVMVESKCAKVNNAQSANNDSLQQPNNELWQARIALHHTLLHHPDYGPALRQLLPDWSRNQEKFLANSTDKQYYIAGTLNGMLVEALPDTGTDACFISSKLASRLGLLPVPETQKKIIITSKKVVQSPGMVKVSWKFGKERKEHIINCWILPGCTSDLVLGSQFLLETHTLSEFRNRIKSTFIGASTHVSSNNSQRGVHRQELKEMLRHADYLEKVFMSYCRQLHESRHPDETFHVSDPKISLLQGIERLIAKKKERESKQSELLAAIFKLINDLTVSTDRKRTNDFSSGEKEFYVGGSVNGTVVEALPDTGAEACFISPRLISRLGLYPIPGLQKWITLANKKAVKSPGMVTVPWKFSKEQITQTINCWILPGCVSDLVLGNDFLKATNALKKVCYRIKSKLLGACKRLSLSYLGNEKQRLRGYLNGHLTAALPDTGSDAMLINGAYARKIGLEVDSNIENRGAIRLADGSTARITGIVRNVEWRVGSTTVQCNFYVLENLCVDVILSNNYLFEMNIFSEQEEHFFDIHSEDDSRDYRLYFCILSLDKKNPGTSSKACILTLQELKDLEKQEELYRRDKSRDKIMALPEDQQEAATQAENARQKLWEVQKPEREAKWINELHMATSKVQIGVSQRSWWKKPISTGFFDKGVKVIARTRPTEVPQRNRANPRRN